MKIIMRVPILTMRVPMLVICAALSAPAVRAQALSDADRETLLENLEKIEEASDSKVDARFRVALAAFRNAMTSDDAAMDLYLNCMEKVNYTDLRKKPADFREWKVNEREKLSDPGMRLALRHQLRWLMLTLEAASKSTDRNKLVADAQEALDGIFRDATKLKNQQEILTQAVTSSVFARAYDINNVEVQKWSLSPIDVDGIYEDILLPPHRKPNGLATLRAGWIKRIQQETVKAELWTARRRPNREDRENRNNREDRSETRIGMADDMQSPEYQKFIEEDLPELIWDMEVDLFRNGDESGSSVRMLAHLQKYVGHPSAREWSTQFKALLKPEVIIPPAETAEQTTS